MGVLLGFIVLAALAAYLMMPNKGHSQSESKPTAADENPISAELAGSASFQLFTVGRTMQRLTDLLASQGLVNDEEAKAYLAHLIQSVFKEPYADNRLTIEQVMSAMDAELLPVYDYAKQLREQGTPHAESMALSLKAWHESKLN